jgi:hypothetical protein
MAAGDMYAGAIGPSIIQVALFVIWAAIVSVLWPKEVPALPAAQRTLKGWALWAKCLKGIVPSLGLIFLVLGTISVNYWIEKSTGIDPSKVNIEIQLPDMPPPLDLKIICAQARRAGQRAVAVARWRYITVASRPMDPTC